MIKTVIFDCFGVICHPVVSEWFKRNVTDHGYSDEKLPAILERFDLGELSEDDLIDHFLAYEWLDSSKESVKDEIDSYLSFDKDIIRTIEKLQGSGFTTALLSNGNESFFERTIYRDYPGFKDLFDEIVISSSVKMVKPNADIYLHTLKSTGSRPEEALFVDDRQVNVDAATNLGMDGHVYRDNETLVAYLESIDIDVKEQI